MNVPPDPDIEGQLLNPHELAALAPSIRRGRRISPATLKRWMRVGLRGERLPYVMSGTQPCSTKDALLDFFRRLAQADENRRFALSDDRAANTSEKSAEAEQQRLAIDHARAKELGL